ncbi:MAG: DUF2058 domain-containing protein [Candidatus Electrothrix sp. AR4]|nr:DUF2058 domain-containing protein [Candidatus Electrothrix sp. AR4]
MGNPLQDQLIKAGLANKKQAGKAKREQYLSRKKKKKTLDPPNKTNKERAALAQRNRELNTKRAEEKKRHEQRAQIKQLIEKNRLKRDENGELYHFAVQNKIHRIFAAEEMIDQLCDGKLAVVKFNNGFEVVPAKVAQQIASRDKEVVVALRER